MATKYKAKAGLVPDYQYGDDEDEPTDEARTNEEAYGSGSRGGMRGIAGSSNNGGNCIFFNEPLDDGEDGEEDEENSSNQDEDEEDDDSRRRGHYGDGDEEDEDDDLEDGEFDPNVIAA